MWERAVTGDVAAATAVLRIVEQRCRLLGLDRPAKASARPASIIVPGHEEEFAAVLAATQGGHRGVSREG